MARALTEIKTKEHYFSLVKSKAIPDNDAASRLPYRPDLFYKSDWIGWEDFLIG